MPSTDRGDSRGSSCDRSVSHKHSSSDLGKLFVPMWDSSDPERAPPPLPLNPSTPNASPVRANASSNVAAAAYALVERARENLSSPYVTNAAYNKSPEKSPTKGPQHKRLQSLQSPGVWDQRNTFENTRSGSPFSYKPSLPQSPESSPDRSITPTPQGNKKDPVETPPLRPSSRPVSRPPLRPLLSDTPTSATMLAIQNMKLPEDDDMPLKDVTNGATPRGSPKVIAPQSQSFDSIHSQMLNLTNIANILQKEMSALSRRSKDNATDLISLKEATSMRDEDIRKSLRELVVSVKTPEVGLLDRRQLNASRSSSSLDVPPTFAARTPFMSPSLTKSASAPKFSPSHAFDLNSDADGATTATSYSLEGTVGVAMLEKIIREMGTKDGQDKLVSTLAELLKQSSQGTSATSGKIAELADLIREKSTSNALVRHSQRRNSASSSASNDDGLERSLVTHPSRRARSDSHANHTANNTLNEEMLKLLQKIKDSVAQSGGMTAEVKALMKDLRGEVLGMGRDLGRRVETMDHSRSNGSAISDAASKHDIERIVQDSLADLKEQMDDVIQTRRRQSSSTALSRNTVDSQEVYEVVKHALAERGLDQSQTVANLQNVVDRDSILAAVKEAYEEYKPEIELQQFGLERDEILQCLKEGLEDYQSKKEISSSNRVDKEEIMLAVQEAMQNFKPPVPLSEASEIKAEILESVKACLEDLQLPAGNRSVDQTIDISREDILNAIHESLDIFKKEGAREIEISPDDLNVAVQNGLNSMTSPFGVYGQQVLDSLHEIVAGMRIEFKQYSAANGRDTEQVLDATKDGLESLRAEIESYVDRAQDVTGKEEIIAALRTELGGLRASFDDFVLQDSTEGTSHRSEMVEMIKSEFAQLHETFGASTSNRGLDDSSAAQLETLKDELDRMRVALLDSSAAQKSDLLETIQDALDGLHAKISEPDRSSGNAGELIRTMRDEFDILRESLKPHVRSPSSRGLNDYDDSLVSNIKEALDEIHVQMSANQAESSNELLVSIKEELDTIRQATGGSMVLSSPNQNRDEILVDIRSTLENIQAQIKAPSDGAANEVLEEIKVELEQLRQSLPHSGVQSVQDFEALAENLDTLRIDIAKMADKPVDMTVSYEILDMLKDGLLTVKADLEKLKIGTGIAQESIILADSDRSMSIDQPNGLPKKSDFDRIEVMLAQSHIKLEAMDQNIQNTNTNDTMSEATRAHLSSIEATLRGLQTSIEVLSSRKATSEPISATKEDTDAIETLLQNSKAKIDDKIIPALESIVTREHLDSVEAVVRMTNETLETLTVRLEDNTPTKEDIAAIALLVSEATTSMSEMKDNLEVKEDIEGVGGLCLEIKEKLENMPTTDAMPSREDIASLTVLLQELNESHTSLKERYEGDIGVTAKAFDDRKDEASTMLEQIQELKDLVECSKDELKTRMKSDNEDVQALNEVLENIESKIEGTPDANIAIHNLREIVKSEFERARENIDTIKGDQDLRSAVILGKYEEHGAIIISDLTAKLDDRFNVLLARHNDQMLTSEATFRSVEARALEQNELLAGSRAVAEDLKITIDTLGSTVTTISPALAEATERMAEDSKIVYNKVDELHSRADTNHSDNKAEHQLTREEVNKSLAAISSLHEVAVGRHPELMNSLGKLVAVTEQHFEHTRQFTDTSTRAADDLKAHFNQGLRSLPGPQLDTIPMITSPEKYDDSKVHSKLDTLLSSNIQYDDVAVQTKLNELLEHAAVTKEAPTQLAKIDEIQQQLMSTATEVSAFIALQSTMLIENHEDKVKEASQAAMDVDKRLTEKSAVESKIVELQGTQAKLLTIIEGLKAERSQLSSQKMHLAADVSSLETALKIRREELHMMDIRADALERRIIEGVMDQSRSLLMTKTPRGPANMNLKRVSSSASHATAITTTPSSIVNAGVGMAIKTQRPSVRRSEGPTTAAGRRIASLGQINNNATSRSKGLQFTARNVNTGIDSLKRSQSVKTSQVLRKPSWNGPNMGGVTSFDKENDILSEADELIGGASDDEGSVVRSVSYSGTHGTDGHSSYGPSEYTSGSSYFSGSDADRRTSHGTVVESNVGTIDDPIHEEGEDVDEHNGEQQEDGVDQMMLEAASEAPLVIDRNKHGLVLHGPNGYDSGLGSDMPTAGMSSMSSDYFKGMK